MTLQILTIFLGSLLLAIGVVSLIGPRRLAAGAAIVALAIPLGLVLFVIAAGVLLYRRYGGG
jgi:hypothetical protein